MDRRHHQKQSTRGDPCPVVPTPIRIQTPTDSSRSEIGLVSGYETHTGTRPDGETSLPCYELIRTPNYCGGLVGGS